MKRKLIILLSMAVCLLIALPAYFAFADNDFLTSEKDKDTIGADEELNFKIDLSAFKTEENIPYIIEVKISPSEPALGIDLQEDIDVTYNKKKGTYVVRSEDFAGTSEDGQDLQELNFTARPDTDLEEITEYTVTAKVSGGEGFAEAEESIAFKAEPLGPTEPTDPTEPTEPTTEELPEEPDIGDFGGEFGDSDPGAPAEPEYKGSSDNYLKSLYISGHEMTQKFHKTRSTYFVDLDKAVSTVDVHAAANDGTAKVDIAGNRNVSADMSKIVINVTAQNGDVRVYRIYVRHK